MSQAVERRTRVLGDIQADVLALEELLLEAGGDITDAETERIVDEWFKTLGAERDRKLDSYCVLIEESEAIAQVRKAAAQRLLASAKTTENLATRLRDRLKHFLEVHGLRRIDTIHYSMWTQPNGRAPIVVTDPALVPSEYKKTKVIEELDSIAIRRVLEEGGHIPGVALGERGSHLRLK